MKKIIATVAAAATLLISACSTTQKTGSTGNINQDSVKAENKGLIGTVKEALVGTPTTADIAQKNAKAEADAQKKAAKLEAKQKAGELKALKKQLEKRRSEIGIEASWFLKNQGDSLIATEHGDSRIEFTKGFPKASEDLKKAFSKDGFKVTGALINTSRNSFYNFSFRTDVMVQDSLGGKSYYINGCKVPTPK